MEKTVTIDIEDVENGTIFTEYDEEGKYVSVKEWGKEFVVMREIKFRGRKPNGVWIYGDLVTTETTDGKPTKKEVLPFDKANIDDAEYVEQDTIGQFTGLLDYDGKEIFEGDIVKCCYMIPEWGWSGGAEKKEEEVIGAVEYCRGDFCIGEYPIVGFQENEMEVIGNIYDNSELLKNL